MKKLPSLTNLRKVLLESVFDPRKPGPMAVVVEMNNPVYCQLKAIELIKENNSQENIAKAISLLALSRVQNV